MLIVAKVGCNFDFAHRQRHCQSNRCPGGRGHDVTAIIPAHFTVIGCHVTLILELSRDRDTGPKY